jgi:hypothetical protein
MALAAGSRGLTMYNRTMRDLPNAHWIDAICVGKATPEQVVVGGAAQLELKAGLNLYKNLCYGPLDVRSQVPGLYVSELRRTPRLHNADLRHSSQTGKGRDSEDSLMGE